MVQAMHNNWIVIDEIFTCYCEFNHVSHFHRISHSLVASESRSDAMQQNALNNIFALIVCVRIGRGRHGVVQISFVHLCFRPVSSFGNALCGDSNVSGFLTVIDLIDKCCCLASRRSFNSFRAWLSDHYQPDRLVHMCKIDTFDPDRNNRHKQNQELGWSSCIMNIFRKLFKFRTFQGETWKINDERGKFLMNTSACSAIQGFVRISADFSLSASYYTRRRLNFVDVYQIWWRICLSRFGKRSATTMMKFSRNSKTRVFEDDIEIAKSKNCFLFILKVICRAVFPAFA